MRAGRLRWPTKHRETGLVIHLHKTLADRGPTIVGYAAGVSPAGHYTATLSTYVAGLVLMAIILERS